MGKKTNDNGADQMNDQAGEMRPASFDWSTFDRDADHSGDLRQKGWARLTSSIRSAPRLRALLDLGRMVGQLRGGARITCNACGNKVRLLPFGMPLRNNAMCPKCGSLERHRLMLRYLSQRPELLEGANILHFAPEKPVEAYIRSRNPKAYRTGDIEIGRGDLQLSIEDSGLPADSLDLVIASHVLEHVDDDAALTELHRILKPGGAVLLMVPIIEGWDKTYENEAVTSAAGRAHHFGQEDHVRRYGRDLRERVAKKGFELEEFTGSHSEAFEYGFLLGETVFVARKPVV